MDGSAQPVLAEIRRERMLNVIHEREFVRITALAEAFNVSVVTVRADLDLLQGHGLIHRVRGGARAVTPGGQPERPAERAPASAALEKAAIAKAAAQLVDSGGSIVIDAGSTTAFLARELAARQGLTDVVVITNSTLVARELEPAIPRFAVVLSGGTLRPLQHALVDPMGGSILERIHADAAFLSCSGVHAGTGVTTNDMSEAEMKNRMIKASSRHVLLADSTKLGRTDLAPVCGLDDVDLLITAGGADPVVVEALRKRGLYVDVCSLGG